MSGQMTLTGEMTSRRLIYWQSCQFIPCSTTSHRARAKFLRTAISLHIEVLFLDLPGCVSDCRVNRPGVQISDSHGRLLFGSGSRHSQFDRRGVLLHFRSVARVVTVRCDCRSFGPDEPGRVGVWPSSLEMKVSVVAALVPLGGLSILGKIIGPW